MVVIFDQHFLKNNEVIEIEVDTLDLNSSDRVLEVGPGDGRLSKEILSRNIGKLFSVEKDEKLRKFLEKIKLENPNFDFIISDGLLELENRNFTKFISNVPYTITEPLYKLILKKNIKKVVLLHGKKFYLQILSKNSKWHYFVNSFYEVTLKKEVLGDCFEPKAKVTSVLLELNLLDKTNLKERFFQEIFLRRNRNVLNALVFSLMEVKKISKSEAKREIQKLEFLSEILEKKVESLSNSQFLKIVRVVSIFNWNLF